VSSTTAAHEGGWEIDKAVRECRSILPLLISY
jgi:hypothetical protein